MGKAPFAFTIPVTLAILAGTAGAQQWPASSLALGTNGSSLTAGDCVRLTLVATDDTPGPFAPTVSYAFSEAVTVKDDTGTRVETRRVVRERTTGATIDRLAAGAVVVLDDSLCFGQGSVPGRYEITVGLSSSGWSGVRLTTCVDYHPDDAGSLPVAGCSFALHGVLRRDSADALTLDATADGPGLYRLLVLRGDRLLHVIEGGVAFTGLRELLVFSPALADLGAAPVDLVLHDQSRNRSAAATRLVIGR